MFFPDCVHLCIRHIRQLRLPETLACGIELAILQIFHHVAATHLFVNRCLRSARAILGRPNVVQEERSTSRTGVVFGG